MNNSKSKNIVSKLSALFIFVIVLTSCNISLPGINSSPPTSYPKAEVVFQVLLPSGLEAGNGLYLEILDEVTGLFFNPTRFEMARSTDSLFFVKVPVTIGAEINYRYVRISDSVDVEYNSYSKQISSRKLLVTGPELVQDKIAGWENEPYIGTWGRIRGQIIDLENQAPIPDLIITAAGLTTNTSSDGTFILENVPTGVHNMVIYSKDGLYKPFQQYAKVDDTATTPVFVELNKRQMVAVTFIVDTPDAFEMRFPIKIAGTLSSLGNPFTTLSAGTGNTATALPVMENTSDGKYKLTMNLPSGTYIRYKYTLGDGFWNSELNTTGNFVLREFIVPSQDATLRDEILTFESPEMGEVIFKITAPGITPAGDSVFIQLNPYDWMEPLPMLNTGPNRWEYAIYSPTHLVNSTAYRFCRKGDCTKGLNTPTENNSFTPSQEAIQISKDISGWINLLALPNQSFVDNGTIIILPNTELINGVELSSVYPSTWSSSIETGLRDIKGTGANWVVLSPRWSITSTNPPMIEPSGSQDLGWVELQWMINHVKLQELSPVLFPQVNYSNYQGFWDESTRDSGWWQSYHDRYQRFILNYADLAQLMEVEAIIIGDPRVIQQMEFSPDSEARWLQLISDIRSRYKGKIIAAISLPSVREVPGWISEVDQIYVLFSPDLTNSVNLIATFGEQLDSQVYPLFEKFGKSIIIGVNNPSNTNSKSGCVDTNGSCLSSIQTGYPIDTTIQAQIINSAVVASFSRPWVTGFISREYYPYLKVHDNGPSLYGKPGSDVLWFWYHLIQNITP